MYKHFSFKGPPIALICSASYINLEDRNFLLGLSGDGTEFWAPVTAEFWAPVAACPPNWEVWSTTDTALGVKCKGNKAMQYYYECNAHLQPPCVG